MSRVGKNIKILRELKRITQTDLARAVGVAPAYLSQIETMLRMPSLGVLQRTARALGTSVETLVGSEPELAWTGSSSPRERIRLLRRLIEEMEQDLAEGTAPRIRGG